MARPKNTKNCGRFSGHENDNTTTIEALNRRHAEEITGYKQFAAARRAKRKYTQEKAAGVLEAFKAYISNCDANREPVTIAGAVMAAGFTRDAASRAKSGEMDYLLEEYLAVNNISIEEATIIDGMPYHLKADQDTGEIRQILLVPYSVIWEKMDLLIQDQLEKNCYTNKGNPAGSIFGLKAKFDWRDDPAPQHIENTLIIADKEQATKALKMLTNG